MIASTLRIFSLYLFFALLPASADWIDVLAVSPQKTWQIQRRQADNLDGGDPEFIDFVNLKSGKIAFSFTSIRRSTNATWSSDGSSVVINDRTATSGDFLYIFRVTEGHVVLIRTPGDDHPGNDYLTYSLIEAYKQLSQTGRFTLTGRQWLSNSSLLIRVTGGGYGDDAAFEATINIDDLGRISFDKKSVKRIN